MLKFGIPGIAFLATVAFGFWLSHAGKPYNGILFNVHKLIALGVVIAFGVQAVNTLKIADSPAVMIALLAVAALCVIALFASGALMSVGKLDYATMLTLHRVASSLATVAVLALIYWFYGVNSP